MKRFFRSSIAVPAAALAIAALLFLLRLTGAVRIAWPAVAALSICAGLLFAASAAFEARRLRGELARISSLSDATRIDARCLLAEELNGVFAAIEDSQQHLSVDAEYKDIQLKMLMNQINPHFLYNTLESIRGQALCNGDLIVADMAETLSIFFRYCISQKGTIVKLEDEINNINIYLKIMKFRLPEKFEFSISIDDPNCLDCEIPKLTLQPIIENTILHGINSYKTGGLISVRILETDACLKIYIRDNGVGINSEALREINENLDRGYEQSGKRSGIALYNINRRIKLIYGNPYGLRIYSTEGLGMNVSIYLPKKRFDP